MKLSDVIITESVKPPKTLYHGSKFKTKILKPGFEWSHELQKWDKTENNHFLYLTTNKNSAILLGFASSIEHTYGLSHFKNYSKTIEITTDKKISMEKLMNLTVYLYTIHPDDENIVKNTNAQNNLSTEWKTKDHLKIENNLIEKIDMRTFLKKYKITLKTKK